MRPHCNCIEHAGPSGRHVLQLGLRSRLGPLRVLVPQRESSTAIVQRPKKGKSPSPGRQSAQQNLLELAGPVQEFAQQLINSISQRVLNAQEQATVLQEAQALEQARKRASEPPDITPFLTQVPVWELKQMRRLCHLTALTYKMGGVTPRKLKRQHGVDLVTTSWACEIRPYEHAKTAEEVMGDGDGMAVSFAHARTVYQAITGGGAAAGGNSPSSTNQSGVGNNVLPGPAAASGNPQSGSKQGQGSISGGAQQAAVATVSQKGGWLSLSPADVVATKIAEAAAAASTAAVTPLASAATSLYAGLASLPIAAALGAIPRNAAPTAAAALAATAARAAASSEDKGTGGTGTGSAAATVSAAAGVVAIAAATGTGPRLAPAAPQSTTTPGLQPSEWFVCDDAPTHTRTFVIQGSDTLDHWRLNLTFDPVVFEDPALGVKVHRGVYEAAQVLYERFLPMVYEHVDSWPFAKVTFTGHSVGGALATLLALMFVRRGVVPPAQLSTVYPFGAPAVFCVEDEQQLATTPVRTTTQPPQIATKSQIVKASIGSGSSSGSSSMASSDSDPQPTAATAQPLPAPATPPHLHKPGCRCGQHEGPNTGLLASLGLSEHLLRNVIMHRDIVPRAFACDYSRVSDILMSWGPAFKNHHGLRAGRKHLYYFVGRMLVMQPDRWHSWVVEPDHPMLPSGPDLYLLGPTQPGTGAAAATARQLAGAAPLVSVPMSNNLSSNGGKASGNSGPASAASNAKAAVMAPGSSQASGPPARVTATTHGEALFSLMDNPHPLDLLTDPGAYMTSGSISRYHNPDNYTAALGRLIFRKRVAEGGRFPRFVSRAYSRSLRLESLEEAGVPAPVEVSNYDSSDADALAVPPALAVLQAAQDLPHW